MNPLIADNVACLDQGIALLQRLTPAQFTWRCRRCFNSTMGGHFRHNSDHYESFLAHYRSGRIDYDDRERNSQLEADPLEALALHTSLRRALQEIGEVDLDRPVVIKMDGGASDEWSQSSLRRDLQFLLSHTIHHYALIVAIGSEAGVAEFPAGFGIAPSTLKHRRHAG